MLANSRITKVQSTFNCTLGTSGASIVEIDSCAGHQLFTFLNNAQIATINSILIAHLLLRIMQRARARGKYSAEQGRAGQPARSSADIW